MCVSECACEGVHEHLNNPRVLQLIAVTPRTLVSKPAQTLGIVHGADARKRGENKNNVATALLKTKEKFNV